MQKITQLNRMLRMVESWKNQATWASIRWISETTTWRSYRDGFPAFNNVKIDDGVLVEVFENGHSSYCATSDLSEIGLQRAFHKAQKIALEASPLAVHKFNLDQIRPSLRGEWKSQKNPAWDALSLAEINSLLKSCDKALKATDEVVSSSATLLMVEAQHSYFSTSGAQQFQAFYMTGTDLQASAQRGSEFQSRSLHGGLANCVQGGLEHLDKDFLIEKSQQIGFEAVELLSAPECPTGVMDLILMPDQMNLQIHESIGHPLEYDRILGDERNYAGWSFVKPHDFGKLQYGSPMMNVTFDPTVQGQFASYAYDDIGHQAQREFLIQGGVLQRGLGSLESQTRLNLPGVANMRTASWNRAPIDRMANINLEPGEASLSDMISQVEKGVIMQANKSWSIDDYRNKFQFGCELGQLIENGKVVGLVKNPNYRSQTLNFWNSLKTVGSSATREAYGSPYCGKGEPSQVIRYSHSSPACLFSQVEVFGGH
jgi:predicted Zn-dependent protease